MIKRSSTGKPVVVHKVEDAPEVESVMRSFRRQLRDVFDDLRSEIEQTVRDAVADPEGDWQAVVDKLARAYRDAILSTFLSGIGDGLTAGRRATARRYGMAIDFDITPESAIENVDEYVERVTDEVIDTIGGRLGPRLRDWFENGLSYDEVAERIQQESRDVLGEYALERHARTLVHGAAERGNQSAIEDSSAIGKEWIATDDNRTRLTHRRADGQIVPVEGQFDVGQTDLFHPGDPTGPPGEIVNCRCTCVPVFESDLTEEQARRLKRGERLYL
ncbi:hypothetical protein Z052_01995 [Halorubrum sp. C191]|uniref:phage minor head protein n=1 Tax=Halorubrum sp. C191 TaxID=1383842 RepID=UPI000C07366D|nr:phage minor head protein [Halorubrum sp. C191]PHQ43935.1 hypothetical protein Z052_01995 [Halorubrum sp. C191]